MYFPSWNFNIIIIIIIFALKMYFVLKPSSPFALFGRCGLKFAPLCGTLSHFVPHFWPHFCRVPKVSFPQELEHDGCASCLFACFVVCRRCSALVENNFESLERKTRRPGGEPGDKRAKSAAARERQRFIYFYSRTRDTWKPPNEMANGNG